MGALISGDPRQLMWKDLPIRLCGRWLYALRKGPELPLYGMVSWLFIVLRCSRTMLRPGPDRCAICMR